MFNQYFTHRITHVFLPSFCSLPTGILTPKNASDSTQSNGFASVEQHPVSPTGPATVTNTHQNNTHSESRNQKRKGKESRFFGDILVNITPKSDDNISLSSSSASSSVADSEPSEPTVDLFTNSRSAKKHLNLEIDNCDRESVDSEKAYHRLATSNNRNSNKSNRSTSPSISKIAANSHSNNYEKESVSGNPGNGRKQKGSRDAGVDLSPKQDDLY
jgi:hypothetical protein